MTDQRTASSASRAMRVLIVEDVEDDAALIVAEVRRSGYAPIWRRVETKAQLVSALEAQEWDAVVCDYNLPDLDAPSALKVLQERGVDLPFIIVSGHVGEDTAVRAMKAGAHDFMFKGLLKRLVPALEREIRDAADRRAQREAEPARERAEAALRTSEQRFRTLVDSIDDLVFTIDRDRRYDGVYGRRLARTGVEPSFFLGKTAMQLFGADGGPMHEDANARALGGEFVVYEYAAPGEDRQIQNSLAPMQDAAGAITGAVGISRDVTEQRRVQAQLLVSDRMASVGTLAAGVAHEINNPLSVVLANLEFLDRELVEVAEKDPDLGGSLRDARDAARRVRDIVRDLKIFSRSREDQVLPEPVDVQAVLDSSSRMAWNEIRHRAKLVKTYGAVPPVLATEARLGQVFLNLIVNAAQAIPDGSAEKNEIRLETSMCPDGRVCTTVTDTGPGIPPETLKRLFTPFFTTKEVGLGTGLGLSICHRIVTAFGGEIEVESEVGKGTTFRVMLPSAEGREATPVEVRAAVVASRRGRVLIVDDESAVAASLARLLSPEHDVATSTSGRAALDRIRDGERFDAILCDVMMPELSGQQVYEELLRTEPDQAARMAFVTGGAFTPDAIAFLEGFARPILDKPFDPEDVRAVVAEMLARPSDEE